MVGKGRLALDMARPASPLEAFRALRYADAGALQGLLRAGRAQKRGRRGKLAITRRMETYLLTAYRAEQQADGRGGGVSLEKVGHRVSDEMSRRLGEIVMSPLNKQLALSMGFYVLLASTAWQWLSMFADLAARP
jgi:hypothetical protein